MPVGGDNPDAADGPDALDGRTASKLGAEPYTGGTVETAASINQKTDVVGEFGVLIFVQKLTPPNCNRFDPRPYPVNPANQGLGFISKFTPYENRNYICTGRHSPVSMD